MGHRMIRGLTIAAGAAATLYGGYWFVARAAAERAADALVADLRASGWQVTMDDLRITGFPSRIDATASGLVVADPSGVVSWQAPEFTIFALSYRPNDVIAGWPAEQVLTVAGERMTVAAEGMRASAQVSLAAGLPVESATAESGPVTITADAGWTMSLDGLVAAFRRGGPGPADYDLFAEARDVAPPAAWVAALAPPEVLPPSAEVLRVDALVTLDRPIDRQAPAPAVQAVTLREAHLTWGDVGLTVQGTLRRDAQGRPEGELSVSFRNWPRLLQIAVAAGIVTPDAAPAWDAALNLAAFGDVSVTAPLVFADGQMSLGPVPLGPVPALPYSQ